MKIKYDLTNERFKYYNTAWGINLRKKIFKKNPNKKIFNYTTIGIFYFFIIIILLLVGSIFIGLFDLEKHIDTFSSIISLLFGILVFYYFFFFMQFLSTRKKMSSGTLVIDKDGISDISDDKITVKFGWEQIQLIAIKENEIVILSKDLLIISKLNNKDKLINTIRKYNKNVSLVVK